MSQQETDEASGKSREEETKEQREEDFGGPHDVAEGPTSPSDWLTEDVLQEALARPSQGRTENLKVTGFHLQPALGKGENYASELLRLRVDVMEDDPSGGRRAGHRDLVAKCLPSGRGKIALSMASELFPNEERVYREVLPRMHDVMRAKMRPSEIVQLAPMHYLSSSGNLLFEDLCGRGYKLGIRQTGLDLQHCLLAVRTLATFHALSMALFEEDTSLLDFPEVVFHENNELNKKLTPKAYELLAKYVKSWRGYEKYASKIRDLGKDVYDRFLEVMAQTPDRYKVLNHGDYWVNNMMFKYSPVTGEPMDCKLIDYQVVRFTSLSLDLHYFFNTSPRPDIRTLKMDEMVSAYHSALGTALVRLGLPQRMMSRQELDTEMERTSIFGVMTACGILPIVVADPKDALDFESYSAEDLEGGSPDFMASAMAGENYAKALKFLLPYWESKGWL